ncbi:hypothetical protein C6P40_004889, partial [Pichia californica]
SKFFNDKSKRNFQNFQNFNNFLNSLLKQDLIEFSIIMFTIIENENYEIDFKKNVIDYIIYIILDKSEELELEINFKLIIYLLVNSILSFLSNLNNNKFNKFNKILENDDLFWEKINLLFNILNNKFSNLIVVNNGNNDWKEIIYNKEINQKVDICILLDILGYIGIIYSKNGENWEMKLMKNSKNSINKLDKEIGNNGVDIKEIQLKLKDNIRIKNPIFFDKSRKIALININKLSIEIWDLENKDFIYQDNMNIEVLKNDSIPLKIPDFN